MPTAVSAQRTPAPDTSDLGEVVLRSSPLNDDRLADLFEADGRRRILAGLDCPLRRYIDLIPDSRTFPIAVDSAIDVSLRALARKDGLVSPQQRHADELSRDFPALAEPIKLATLLAQSIVATQGIQRPARSATSAPLPREIGPMTDAGHPRYLLTSLLGEGSSGTVYKAVDRLLSDADHKALVAVKLIPVDSSAEDLLRHYAQEATKARRIDHPNVVRVLDRGVTADGEVFVVSELISGGDLQSYIAQRTLPLPPREAASLIASIADGVQAAHSVGLVHADLKPANVVLSESREPKVVDFGLATSAQDPWFSLATSSPGIADLTSQPVAGNLAFIAPEQYRREAGAVSPAADIYALGGILAHLLTGTYPNGSTAAEISHRHETMDRSTPPTLQSAPTAPLDPTLLAIASRALHPDPARRHASAAALAADLRAWLEHRPIQWMHTSPIRRASLATRRHPWMVLSLTTAALALATGLFGAGFYARRAQAARQEQVDTRANDRDKVLHMIRQLESVKARGEKPTVPELQEKNKKLLSDMDSFPTSVPPDRRPARTSPPPGPAATP